MYAKAQNIEGRSPTSEPVFIPFNLPSDLQIPVSISYNLTLNFYAN